MHFKVCCISSIKEAQMAIDAGASAIGLVGPMPSGPGVISNELIARIAPLVPTGMDSFLLTSETSTDRIIAHHRLVNTSTIQIVDALERSSYDELRAALPGVKLVQVLHVMDEKSIGEALALAHQVDMILLDSGNPNLAIKQLGGTGRVHNWAISQRIVQEVDIPVFLAGGLNPDNAAAAIEQVQPYGLDICSGLRTGGQLDPYKLERFARVVSAYL